MAIKPTTPKSKMEPPSTWSVKTEYGLAKTAAGVPLVRLEDVYAWLMESKDIPSSSASTRVFSVFVSDAASELGVLHSAAKVRSALHILDPVEHASGYGVLSGRLFFAEASEAFPYVPHHHFDIGTEEALLYSMGLAAAYVWLSTSSDGIQGDLNRQLDGYCPVGEFQSHAVCKGFLGRLAVSLDIAHALWGWGTVAEVVQLQSVKNPITAPLPVAVTQPKKVPQRELASEWDGGRLKKRLTELKQNGVKAPTQNLAAEISLPVREITRRIKDYNPSIGAMVARINVAK
jgi:hypothetical protein